MTSKRRQFFVIACLLLSISCFDAIQLEAQGRWKKEKEELIASNADFKQCHAATLVEYAPGQMLAAWFGGTHEGHKDVAIWVSRFSNGAWAKSVAVADGKDSSGNQYPCWNPVLFLDQAKQLHLYYKVGPNPREWWGMEMISTDNGQTWSAPRKIALPALGPIRNKPIQLDDGTILSPSSVETTAKWTAHMERSTDGGKTWTFIPIDHQGSFEVIQPTLLRHPKGRVQALFRSKQGFITQSWSSDNGMSWTAITKTSLQNPNSGIDAVTLTNGWHMLVYNPDVPGKDWSDGRAKLNVAISKDGEQWKDLEVLENESKGEFSYPAIIQTGDGKVHILYTYARKNVKHVVLSRY